MRLLKGSDLFDFGTSVHKMAAGLRLHGCPFWFCDVPSSQGSLQMKSYAVVKCSIQSEHLLGICSYRIIDSSFPDHLFFIQAIPYKV